MKAAWCVDPVTMVVTCAGSAVARLAARSICSLVGPAIHWRSASDVAAMLSLAGGPLGAGHRQRLVGGFGRQHRSRRPPREGDGVELANIGRFGRQRADPQQGPLAGFIFPDFSVHLP